MKQNPTRGAQDSGPAPANDRIDSGAILPRAMLAGKRAAVLLYAYYPMDPRPRRAAEALAAAGMAVDLFCLSETDQDPRQEVIRGVTVHRLSLQRHGKINSPTASVTDGFFWPHSGFCPGGASGANTTSSTSTICRTFWSSPPSCPG